MYALTEQSNICFYDIINDSFFDMKNTQCIMMTINFCYFTKDMNQLEEKQYESAFRKSAM